MRSHPPFAEDENMIPFIFGIVSVFALPVMFWFRKTIILAYLINGFSVIIGTILMMHFSLSNLRAPITPLDIVFRTTFPDILLLWGKFGVGKALFDLELLKSDTDPAIKGRFFRYPNMGWWWVHLIALSMVYALGNILWK